VSREKSERDVDASDELLVTESNHDIDQICPRRHPIRLTLAQYIRGFTMPLFYTRSWHLAVSIIGGIIIAGMFGAIHCLAWNANFPTRIESKLWRVSAVIVTTGGSTLILTALAGACASVKWEVVRAIAVGEISIPAAVEEITSKGKAILIIIAGGIGGLLYGAICIAYVLARICLLVLALLSLRALPYDAYLTASWTLYIPHI
jgi:hypothetical protein